MEMRRLIILAMGMAIVSTPGSGASSWAKGMATFERPVRSSKAILGGESVWFCGGATCRGRAPVDVRSAQRYCRELARWEFFAEELRLGAAGAARLRWMLRYVVPAGIAAASLAPLLA